ncbi:MAG: hypothetical protein ACTSR3_20780 [Candidatus Helarchaeota archaeon]
MKKDRDDKGDRESNKGMKRNSSDMFPVRIPSSLINIMDEFIRNCPELGIRTRQELARRAIADWILQKRRELKELMDL